VVMPRFKAEGKNANQEQRQGKQFVRDINFDMRSWIQALSNVLSKRVWPTAHVVV
jgi:hypothetical protein